jgi:hypothetical protein
MLAAGCGLGCTNSATRFAKSGLTFESGTAAARAIVRNDFLCSTATIALATEGIQRMLRTAESIMQSGMKPLVAIGTLVAFAFTIVAGDGYAQSTQSKRHKPRPVVVVHPLYVAPPPSIPPPPPSPYAPYYYSEWNPYSAYSVYDHLSGGRQQCQLPTEPCDNNHRVSN